MYTIIGGDGKEYGPVTADQVRAWVAAGRANSDTRLKELGTIEWKRLGDHPAFNPGAEPPLAASAAADAFVPAGRWTRLGAKLVDGMLYVLCLMPIMRPMLNTSSSNGSYAFSFSDMVNLAGSPDTTLADKLPVVVIVLLQILLLSTLGQTIGKLLFRIRIVRNRTGGKAGFVHAFLLRSVIVESIKFIPVIGVIFALVDVCFIFRDDRRCVHDLIADTRVVDARAVHGAV
jgi:uncharacterized RDD family membrane protein YckC